MLQDSSSQGSNCPASVSQKAFNFGRSERQLLSSTKRTVHSIADADLPVKRHKPQEEHGMIVAININSPEGGLKKTDEKKRNRHMKMAGYGIITHNLCNLLSHAASRRA